MRLRLVHTTRYKYNKYAIDSQNEVRLMPISDRDQSCLDYRLTIEPSTRIFSYDLPGGRVHHFSLLSPHNFLFLKSEAVVITTRSNPFADLQLDVKDVSFYEDAAKMAPYFDYLAPSQHVPLDPETDRIAHLARKQSGEGTASFLLALTRLLHKVMSYEPGSTRVDTPLRDVLENRRGVCQDFAHLMIAICRRQGIPARYMSGYLYTGSHLKAEDSANTPWKSDESAQLPTEQLIGGDAMHAWVECLLPDGVWRGFDPTNNLMADSHYIKVHHGRDYADVVPIRGVYRGIGEHVMEIAVRVISEPSE